MLRMIGAICLVLFGIDVIYGWDLGYPSIDWIYPEEGIFLLKDTIKGSKLYTFNTIYFDKVIC